MKKLWFFKNFLSKCACTRILIPPYFSCLFCRFSIFVFLAFSFVFSTLSRKWRRTLFVLELRHPFIRYSVHLVNEIVKLLKNSERWENKWSKVKTLPDKPRSRWPVSFYKLCENVIEKAVSRYVIIQQDCKLKLKLYNIKVSSTTVRRCVTNKGWKALKRKKAVHTLCRHGIRRISKLYTKGRPAGKLTWCEPSSNHLDYRWWDNIQRSSPQNTGLAIRQRPRFTWKIVILDTLLEHVHSIPHRLENVRNHKGRHSGC